MLQVAGKSIDFLVDTGARNIKWNCCSLESLRSERNLEAKRSLRR